MLSSRRNQYVLEANLGWEDSCSMKYISFGLLQLLILVDLVTLVSIIVL